MFGSCLICDHQLGLCNTKKNAQEDHGLEKAPKAFYECHNCFVILVFFYQTIALHCLYFLSRPISVSFLIRTSGKEYHISQSSWLYYLCLDHVSWTIPNDRIFPTLAAPHLVLSAHLADAHGITSDLIVALHFLNKVDLHIIRTTTTIKYTQDDQSFTFLSRWNWES